MRFTLCEKCKYNFEGECEFYSMGSGNDIDKPCSGEEEDAFSDSVMDNLRVEEESDVIYRQEAIDALTTECSWTFYDEHGQLTPNGEEILGTLKKMPSAQQWIPCSERLPEEDGDYLVCYEEGYREDYGFPKIGIAPFEVDCEGFGIWQEEFDLHTLGSLGSEWVVIPVDAWMSLPEPYEVKTDE